MTYSRPVPVVMCALLGLILAPASRTLAVDGVIEINQARAVQGGVTPGEHARLSRHHFDRKCSPKWLDEAFG